MKASAYLLPTVKENPADAVVVSHQLLIRAGFIRKLSAGLYHFLPLGLKVLQKIQRIVREEMNLSGALEFELPILTPAELWQQSDRWDKMGKEMFRQKDRHELEYALGPTHEESFVSLMKPILKSYKDLPKNVYQMHTKFRDEIRPRFGVIRSREFIMKDAYSFHLDEESLHKTYELMRRTYRKIFTRCGLATIPVQADSGNMGGSGSEEFMVVSPIGEETLALCSSCGYSGNVEKTPLLVKTQDKPVEVEEMQVVETPGKKTIKEVSEFLSLTEAETIKSVMLRVDEEWNAIVFIRGDREINEVKAKNILLANELRPLADAEIQELGLIPGYTGPVLEKEIAAKLYFDTSILPEKGYVVGANELDKHCKNFVYAREIAGEFVGYDFALVKEKDPCPKCGQELTLEKGIEVGHIFKLGQKYSKAFDLSVMGKNGKPTQTTMGCYGIGINRTMATIIEQDNDDKGIIWPISVAPFEVSLVSLTKKAEELQVIAEIYEYLLAKGIDVLWDDRNLSPGFKLRDSEMIGIPIKLVFGKAFAQEKKYSFTIRKEGIEEQLTYQSKQALWEKVEETRHKLHQELQGPGNS
ncbi:MAG: proline--tRNA ligase [Spirochaetota bacterium]